MVDWHGGLTCTSGDQHVSVNKQLTGTGRLTYGGLTQGDPYLLTYG